MTHHQHDGDGENIINSNNDDDDDYNYFSVQEVAPNVFLCREKYYADFNVANLYVIRGRSMDVIVDTGIGVWDFPAFLRRQHLIEDATKKKSVLAVATHIHFDHAGGLHQFPEFAIHESEANAIRQGDSYEAVCFMAESHIISSKRPSNFKARDYKLKAANPTRVLQHGDVLDLAGDGGEEDMDGNSNIIHLKVLHLPGHSRGSIALWDENNGFLFSGDIIYNAPHLIDWVPYSNIQDYIETMKTLVELAPRVTQVFPGHNDMFDGTKLHFLASTYLNSVGCCHSCTTSMTRAAVTVLFKGRNKKDAKCSKCCFYSCCCCFCF